MKIHRAETVIRYYVTFDPGEVDKIDSHLVLRTKIHIRHGCNNGGRYSRGADAMLTRSDMNDICDVLGVNGREFMAKYIDIPTPSSTDVSLGIVPRIVPRRINNGH